MASFKHKKQSPEKLGHPMTLQELQEVRYHAWPSEIEPMVSICCLTYMHEKYFRETIESFLSQLTTFKVEILIHDDASQDKTVSIIREYEQSYPQLVKPIYQKQNLYSKAKYPSILNLKRAKGKYIALCEGDDYWNDTLKLQKQVEFLEENPTFSVCVGGYSQFNELTRKRKEIIIRSFGKEGANGFSFTLKEMELAWLTKTLTAVVRKKVYDTIDFTRYKFYRDTHFFYHLIKDHKAYYFKENFGVYRIHEGGVSSMKHGKINKNAAYNCYRELYLHNRDEFTRKMYLRCLLGLLNFNLFNRYKNNNVLMNLRLFFEAVPLVKSLTETKMLFAVFLKREWKDRLKGGNF